jgi:hypothetical protein
MSARCRKIQASDNKRVFGRNGILDAVGCGNITRDSIEGQEGLPNACSPDSNEGAHLMQAVQFVAFPVTSAAILTLKF